MQTCPRCGAEAVRRGRCRACGATGGPTGSELGTDPALDPGPASGAIDRDPSRARWLIGLGAVLAVLAVIVTSVVTGGDRGGDGGRDRAAASTSSTEPTRSSSEPATTVRTTRPAPPQVVATTLPVPSGLEGRVALIFDDGMLADLDLATGQLVPLVDLERPYPSNVDHFGGQVLTGHGGSLSGELRTTAADGSVTVLDVHGSIVAAGPTGVALVSDDGALHLGVDGRVTPVVLPAGHGMVGVARGTVLIQVNGHLGSYDPAEGRLGPIADGALVAANDAALTRVSCRIGSCELRAGPWEDIDRVVLSGLPIDRMWRGFLSGDGSMLVVPAWDWDGAAGQRLIAIDLRSGAVHDLDPGLVGDPDQIIGLNSDGRYLLIRDERALVFAPTGETGGDPRRISLPRAIELASIT